MRALIARVIALLVLVVGLAGRPAAGGYFLTDLGALDGNPSRGVAVNVHYGVAGVYQSADGSAVAAFAAGGGPFQTLNTLGGRNASATGINDAGTVVGRSEDGLMKRPDTHAFSYSSSGGLRDLGTLGGHFSEALGINSAGRVVGSSIDGSGQLRGFVTGPNGTGMTDIGSLSAIGSTRATAISDKGTIVGSSTTLSGVSHAFRIADGRMEDLRTLPGAMSSNATAVNNFDQVVGISTDSSGTIHSFRTVEWDGRTMLEDLGTLRGGSDTSPYGINDLGLIVGQARVGSSTVGFLFDPATDRDRMVDLNALISPGSGWALTGAYGISGNGNITGVGIYQGQIRGFLLSLSPLIAVPAPSGLILLGLGAALGPPATRRRGRAVAA